MSSTVIYHRHCQKTVLSASGLAAGSGKTWSVISELEKELDNLPDDWLNTYFKYNTNNITEDLAGIIKLIDACSIKRIDFTPSVESGEKIADIKIGDTTTPLYVPESTSVSYAPTQTSGTEIGTLTIDGTKNILYAPSSTSINVTANLKSGTLVATINGTKIYAPSPSTVPTVSYSPIYTSSNGVEIGNLIVGSKYTPIYAPESSGGSTVSYKATQTSGDEIGTITINGVSTKLYSPTKTSVTYTPTATSTDGTKIGTLCVDGKDIPIYAFANESSPTTTIEKINVPLLTPMWFDYKVSSTNWVLSENTRGSSNNYGWLSGTTYPDIYQHLVNDCSSGTAKTNYTLAKDGHMIIKSSADTNNFDDTTYASTGVAWFYVLDTTNKRFKLPRTKYGFQGIKTSVGTYDAPGLPNITGNFDGTCKPDRASGCFSLSSSNDKGAEAGKSNQYIIFNASNSNSIYGASDTVQPPSTEMYLYFSVGNEQETSSRSVQLENASYVIERGKFCSTDGTTHSTSSENDSWYTLYSDGWCEQGGVCNRKLSNGEIVLFKAYDSSNFTAIGQCYGDSSQTVNIIPTSTSKITYNGIGTSAFSWESKGFIS